MIRIKDGIINDSIIKFHGDWFVKKLTSNKSKIEEMVKELSPDEKNLYLELLGLTLYIGDSNMFAESNIQIIKDNICRKDIKDLVDSRHDICKNFLKLKAKESVERQRKEYRGKEYRFQKMKEIVEKYEADIYNCDEVIKKLDTSDEKIFDLSTKPVKFKETNFEKILNLTFGYSNMNDKYRHELLYKFGLEVCPYCNRQYISNYDEDKNGKTTADLDHYYPQSKYPYLALSLYNFIPSCQICNSRMKGDKEGHLYPYTESFDENDYNVKFELSNNTVDYILGEDTDFNVNMRFYSENGESILFEKNLKNTNENPIKTQDKIERHITVFGLDKIYRKSHNKYIKDMIYNIEKYPETYTNKLAEIFDEDKESLKYHFKEIVKKPYLDRIEKGEPLAKLTKDIMEELGIK